MKNIHRIIGVCFVLFLVSCGKTTDPAAADQYLVSNNLITQVTKETLTLQLGLIDRTLASTVQDGVKAYKIVYKTKGTDGTDIQASGSVIVPLNPKGAMTVASLQHGTIRDDAQAPSNFQFGSETYLAGSLFASQGYIVVAPDYIGYGASKTLPHPYEHRASLASACVDMLRASKEFLKKENIQWNNKLFIGGYSEGGFATMSLQKKIEEDFPTEFDLRASSCGAGAYDKTAFTKFLLSNKTNGEANFNSSYIWTLLTYNRVYGLNRPMNTYFKEPYATQVQSLQQNVNVPGNLSDFFLDSFKKGILDGTDTPFMNAVKDNDVFDWRPKTPTRLFHGDKDTYVFFFNSQNAFDAMRKRGATNVVLVPLPGKDHSSGIGDYLLGTFQFFATINAM